MRITVRKRLALAGSAIGLLLAAPAWAQEEASPFRFLRPSVEGEAEPEFPPEADVPAELAPESPPGLERPELEPEVFEPEVFGPEPFGPAEFGPEIAPERAEPLEIPPPPEQVAPADDAAAAGSDDVPAQEGVADETASDGPASAPQQPAGKGAEAPPATAERALPAPADVPEQPLRLGVLAGRDVRATMAALEPMTEDLTRALSRPVEILPMSSYGSMIDAQALERIDGGFYSASAYALAEAHCQCLEPLVAPMAADGTVAYHAIVVAHVDSGVETLADLRDKAVAGAGTDSIGGRRMQLAAMLSEGLDVEAVFGSFQDAGSAEQALRLVESGAADAAFAWSSLAGDVESGYSRGTLADLAMRGEIDMRDYSVIWRSPAITHGPFAVSRGLADAEKAAMEAYLLGLEAALPAAYDALNPFYGGGYVAVGAEDYSGLAVLANEDVDAIVLPTAPATAAPDPASAAPTTAGQ